jgi:hypothetical protein
MGVLAGGVEVGVAVGFGVGLAAAAGMEPLNTNAIASKKVNKEKYHRLAIFFSPEHGGCNFFSLSS